MASWSLAWQIDRCKIKSPSMQNIKELKADWPHPRNYPPTPTDYRHTDNHLRLVMVVVALCCTRQSRVRVVTDGRTDGRNQVHYLPASRSIKILLFLILPTRDTIICFLVPTYFIFCNNTSISCFGDYIFFYNFLFTDRPTPLYVWHINGSPQIRHFRSTVHGRSPYVQFAHASIHH